MTGFGQVSPLVSDPTKYARYMILQGGVQVGLIYVKGTWNDYTEIWQLFRVDRSQGRRGEPTGSQAAPFYILGSFDMPSDTLPDVTMHIKFLDARADPPPPPYGLSHPEEFRQVQSVCRVE